MGVDGGAREGEGVKEEELGVTGGGGREIGAGAELAGGGFHGLAEGHGWVGRMVEVTSSLP